MLAKNVQPLQSKNMDAKLDIQGVCLRFDLDKVVCSTPLFMDNVAV